MRQLESDIDIFNTHGYCVFYTMENAARFINYLISCNIRFRVFGTENSIKVVKQNGRL